MVNEIKEIDFDQVLRGNYEVNEIKFERSAIEIEIDIALRPVFTHLRGLRSVSTHSGVLRSVFTHSGVPLKVLKNIKQKSVIFYLL